MFLKYYRIKPRSDWSFSISLLLFSIKNGDIWHFLEVEDFFKSCNICQIRFWSAQCPMSITYCLGAQYQCTCTFDDQVGKRSWKRKEISQFISILCYGFEKNILFLWNSRLLTATCKPSIYLSLICQYIFVDDTIVMFLFSSPWGGLEIVLCNIEARIVSGGRL